MEDDKYIKEMTFRKISFEARLCIPIHQTTHSFEEKILTVIFTITQVVLTLARLYLISVNVFFNCQKLFL